MSVTLRERPASLAGRHRQSGAVLIVSMVLLIVLTLLAVASMQTTSLEEKMAANLQETTRAFQAAEVGLSQAYGDNAAYDLSGTYTVAPANIADTNDTSEYETDYLGTSAPPLILNNLEIISDIACYEATNFDFTSRGETAAGVGAELHGGAYFIRKIPGKC